MTKELQDLAWSILPKEFREEVQKMWQSADKEQQLPHDAFLRGEYSILVLLFGIHNLTSDAEGEEILTVSRRQAQELFADAKKAVLTCEYDRGFRGAELTILRNLFGSKCLPDETRDKREKRQIKREVPKPSEPKFKPNDKVIFENAVCTIMQVCHADSTYSLMKDKTGAFVAWIAESDLEPYTEPTETCSDDCPSQCPSHLRNLSQKTANCDKCPKSVQKTPPDFGHSRLNIAAMALQGILANSHQQMVEMNVERVVDLAILTADTLIAECNSPIN